MGDLFAAMGVTLIWIALTSAILYVALTSKDMVVKNTGVTVVEVLTILAFVVFLSVLLGYMKVLAFCWGLMIMFLFETVVTVTVRALSFLKKSRR